MTAVSWLTAGIAAVVAGLLVVRVVLLEETRMPEGGDRVAAASGPSIHLPSASETRDLATHDMLIVLNVNPHGHVILATSEEPDVSKWLLTNATQVRNYLKRRAELERRERGIDRAEPLRTMIIIRADREALFVRPDTTDDLGVWDVMKACRAAGFVDVYLQVEKSVPR